MPDQPHLHGDETALHVEHHARLQRLVARDVTTTHETIEDACAHAWLELIRLQPDRAEIVGWLRTVATREAIRLAQRERRWTSLDTPVTAAGTTLVDLMSAGERPHYEAHDALALVGALRPRTRCIFGLHIAGHSYTEIAGLTNNSNRTVERHIMRARTAVRTAGG